MDRPKSPVKVAASSNGRREQQPEPQHKRVEAHASSEASSSVPRERSTVPRRMSDSFILDQKSDGEAEENEDLFCEEEDEEKIASGDKASGGQCQTVIRRAGTSPVSGRSRTTATDMGVEDMRMLLTPTPASVVSTGSQTTNSLVRRGKDRVNLELLPDANALAAGSRRSPRAPLGIPQVVLATQNAAVSTDSLTATDEPTEDATADEEAGVSSEGEVFRNSSVSSDGALGAPRRPVGRSSNRASERRSHAEHMLKPPRGTSRQVSHEKLESPTIAINQLPLNNITLLRKVCYAQLRQVLEYFCPREDWRAQRTSAAKQQSHLQGLFDAFLRRPRMNTAGDAAECTILDQLMRNPHVELLASPSSKAATKARAKALKHLAAGIGGGSSSELTSSCSACPVHQLFGVSLERLQLRFGQPLPPCVVEAMRFVRAACADETRSDTVGIFRRAGNRKNVRSLRRAMELCAQAHTRPLCAPPQQPQERQAASSGTAPASDWECAAAGRDEFRHDCRAQWPETTSVYDVADCVKQFFRELPECLFTRPLSQLAVSLYLSIYLSALSFAPLVLNFEVLKYLKRSSILSVLRHSHFVDGSLQNSFLSRTEQVCFRQRINSQHLENIDLIDAAQSKSLLRVQTAYVQIIFGS